MLFLRRSGVCATGGGEEEIGSGISVEWGCVGCDDVEWEGIRRSPNTWFVKSRVEGRDDGEEGSGVRVVRVDFDKEGEHMFVMGGTVIVGFVRTTIARETGIVVFGMAWLKDVWLEFSHS